MLVGLALIAVPLLIAILTAVLQIRDLAETGQKIVVQGVTGARASQSLFEQIASLERTARLYGVLNDPKLLDLYRTQDEGLSDTREQLHRFASGATRATLEELGELQGSIRATVMSTPGPSRAEAESDLSGRFTQLSSLVERVAQQSNAQVDAEVAALQERTMDARKRLLWQAALLLPLAVVAVFVLTLGVGRPLRKLDRAISELGQGDFTHAIAVNGPHDLERLGGQLEWLRQRLLELAHERNRFLRHMSHELKTPLANIREGTELLMDGAVGELDSNQREVAAILRENGIKLQRMIENLLSFSAWQTSSVGLEATEFRLRPLVKQVLENQQLTLLSQRVRLDVRIEDVTLVADRGKIRLILENLVSNAVEVFAQGRHDLPAGARRRRAAAARRRRQRPGDPAGGPWPHVRGLLHRPCREEHARQGHRHRAVGGAGVRGGARRQRADPRRAVPRRALPHHHADPRHERRSPREPRTQGARACSLRHARGRATCPAARSPCWRC